MKKFLSLPDVTSHAFRMRWFVIGVFASFGALGAMALSTPLSSMTQWEVTCDSVDGGAPQDIMIDTGGVTHSGMSSVYLGNDSTTCVRVGGTGLTSTTGATIGSSCRDSSGISIDTRGGRCLSTGAAVTIDVLAGRQ